MKRSRIDKGSGLVRVRKSGAPAPGTAPAKFDKFPTRNLSFSSVFDYLSCGHYWFLRRIERIPGTKSPDALFGTAFHKTAQEYLTSDRFPGAADLAVSWRKNFSQLRHRWESEDPGVRWGDQLPYDFELEGDRIFRNPALMRELDKIPVYHDGESFWVEKYFSFELEGVPVPIIGYIDVLRDDGRPLDFKTSGKSWNLAKVKTQLQPLFYLWALREMGAPAPENDFLYFIVVRPGKFAGASIGIQKFIFSASEDQFSWMHQIVRNVASGIMAGSFQLAEPGHWKCNPKYCEYWSMCRGALSGPIVQSR